MEISIKLKKVNGGKKPKHVPVRINVYSLVNVNQVLFYTGLGVYHSGVEIYGNEWAFGGHPYPESGIYTMVKPRDLKSLSSIDGVFEFQESLRIGYTSYPFEQIRLMLDKMGEEQWLGNQYHLLYKNCNCFADYLCNVVCNRGIPKWINRISSVASLFPFIIALIPKEYLTPPALSDEIKNSHSKVSTGKRKVLVEHVDESDDNDTDTDNQTNNKIIQKKFANSKSNKKLTKLVAKKTKKIQLTPIEIQKDSLKKQVKSVDKSQGSEKCKLEKHPEQIRNSTEFFSISSESIISNESLFRSAAYADIWKTAAELPNLDLEDLEDVISDEMIKSIEKKIQSTHSEQCLTQNKFSTKTLPLKQNCTKCLAQTRIQKPKESLMPTLNEFDDDDFAGRHLSQIQILSQSLKEVSRDRFK